MWRKLFLLAMLLFFVASCGVAVNPDVVYKGTYASYKRVVNEWTRTKKLYEPGLLETKIIVTATYESADFRKAYIAEKTRAEMLPATESQRLMEESNDELSRVASFFIAAYTPKQKWNDLARHASSWKLWLEDAKGRRVGALDVKQIKIKHKSQTAYYPYFNEWQKYYRAYFPRVTDEGQPLQLESGMITLHVTGVLGNARLVWEIPESQS